MDFVKNLIENVWVQRVFWSAIVIVFSFLIYHVVARVLDAREKKVIKIMNNKKNKTILRMLRSMVAGILSIITVLMVLQIYGVNVNSMLAGVGIASIVIGFALQDSLKDIIRGFVIVSDDYYEIGDVIQFGDNIGPVTSISLLTTKMQDINTMNIVSIANRNIDKVEVASGYVYIPVALPYKVDIEKAEMALKEAVKKLKKHEGITAAMYQGVSDLLNSSRNHQLYIVCDPENQLQMRRDALKIIVESLSENKIEIAHEQLDVHTK